MRIDAVVDAIYPDDQLEALPQMLHDVLSD